MRGKTIGAQIAGVEDWELDSYECKINDISFDDGSEVEVDPIESLIAKIKWVITNKSPGFNSSWDAAVTAYDRTHEKKLDWERSGVIGMAPYIPGSSSAVETLGIGNITEPTVVRINIMANQDYDAPEPALSLWKVRV